VLITIILFYIGFQLYMQLRFKKKERTIVKKTAKKVPCPLCNSVLYGTETLHSTVYKTSGNKEQVCHIHGCPHCHPSPEPGIRRICPVCHKEISPNDHLDAYLFTRAGKKNHIHISGCNRCGISKN
ncbi:MAG TPA: hypothetical protein VFC68_05985, partial [Treponemataceae bacterium]|nr:hypothetical protein [Treponemataceae bacterium]